MEIWKDIVGYEGLYQVSNLGRIKRIGKSMGSTVGAILKPHHDQWNRATIKLRRPGERGKTTRVHKIVLEAFVGPCPDGMEACHFPDRNPSNNQLSNLRWDTKESNQAHRNFHGTDNRGENHPLSKLIIGDIERIFDLSRCGALQREIAAWIGCSRRHISSILSGRLWGHTGFYKAKNGTT